jgi:hypothetical protein
LREARAAVGGHHSNGGADMAERSGTAVGLTLFAAMMMFLIGLFQVMAGFIALFNDTFYVVGQKWLFEFDTTSWGWIHILLGILIGLAGFFVLTGAVWARLVGVLMALANAVFMFAWLPYYPVVAILVIVLDVFVVWALTVHGRDFAE